MASVYYIGDTNRRTVPQAAWRAMVPTLETIAATPAPRVALLRGAMGSIAGDVSAESTDWLADALMVLDCVPEDTMVTLCESLLGE